MYTLHGPLVSIRYPGFAVYSSQGIACKQCTLVVEDSTEQPMTHDISDRGIYERLRVCTRRGHIILIFEVRLEKTPPYRVDTTSILDLS